MREARARQPFQTGSMWEEGVLLRFQGAVLCGGPDGQAESNLVHKVRKIVHQVQAAVFDSSHQVTKEVAQGVD